MHASGRGASCGFAYSKRGQLEKTPTMVQCFRMGHTHVDTLEQARCFLRTITIIL